jgi:hypothetical protein
MRTVLTVQLCVHCRQRRAGFWVSRNGGRVVRRPWCLACCEELDRADCEITPLGAARWAGAVPSGTGHQRR